MKNILVFGHAGRDNKTFNARLEKLGFGVVLPPEGLMNTNHYPQDQLVGEVDVIVYLLCSCCPEKQLKSLPALAYNQLAGGRYAIPVVIVRGGDNPGGNYLILGSVREDASDDVLNVAITNALKLTEEPLRWQKTSA